MLVSLKLVRQFGEPDRNYSTIDYYKIAWYEFLLLSKQHQAQHSLLNVIASPLQEATLA